MSLVGTLVLLGMDTSLTRDVCNDGSSHALCGTRLTMGILYSIAFMQEAQQRSHVVGISQFHETSKSHG